MASPFHVAIVGGGITGLAMAIALHRRHVSFTIYEQAAAFGEIGAGVGMHANALRAMRLIDEAMLAAFGRVATHNAWPDKRAVWFDVLDGTSSTPAAQLAPLFTLLGHEAGHAGCHRARFLDELVPLLPPGSAQFGKRLEDFDERSSDPGSTSNSNSNSNRIVLRFADGTSAEADAVLGCDGIKSRVRQLLVGGSDQPGAKPGYSCKFAYRGLIPMDEAIAALGEERAVNSMLWMGPDHHALTFPVNHGKTLNLVAFTTTDEPWPSTAAGLTQPATRDDALADFAAFGPNVLGLVRMTSPQLERWGLFDLADHPLRSFFRGRVCLVGDAAHASTPHHGAGAALCLEDAAVLAALLADPRLALGGSSSNSKSDHAAATAHCHLGLEAAFASFDAVRRARGQWLVASSRRAADLYEWRARGRQDLAATEAEIMARQAYIWNIDLDAAVASARADLHRRLDLGLPAAVEPDPSVPYPPDIDWHLKQILQH